MVREHTLAVCGVVCLGVGGGVCVWGVGVVCVGVGGCRGVCGGWGGEWSQVMPKSYQGSSKMFLRPFKAISRSCPKMPVKVIQCHFKATLENYPNILQGHKFLRP